MAKKIDVAGQLNAATTEGIIADASQVRINDDSTVDKEVENLNANTGISEYEIFSDQKAYSAGDTVMYNGLLYTFTTDHVAGAWDESQVESASLKGEINKITSKNVYTNDELTNNVIRFLYIDTTGYTGSYNLDNIRVYIISRGYSNKWGIALSNSDGEVSFGFWYNNEVDFINSTYKGIRLYVVFNWNPLPMGERLLNIANVLPLAFNKGISPFVDTNRIVDGSINNNKIADSSIDTNKIVNNSITTEKLADNTITNNKLADSSIDTNKIVNNSITTEKLADNTITNNKLENKSIEENKLSDKILNKLINPKPYFLNFNATNLFNVLDYEGFNANPSVWKTDIGTGTTPIITIEEIDNILGLKYSRCFSIKNSIYDDGYYSAPYFILQLPSLKGVKTKSFCFFVNLKYLYGQTTRLFSAFNGLSNQISVHIKWGVSDHEEISKETLNTISYLSVDIEYLEFKEDKWAFVKGKFWVDDISAVQNDIPTFLMSFVGGQEHLGEKTVTCGWTFVAEDVELLPFQYYSYDKNFFELFSDKDIPNGSITTEKINDKAVTQQKIDDGVNLSTTTLTNGLYGQAGDSISEGAGLQTLLLDSDPYAPSFGTKKATYGYYIAKLNRMRWANYGISGSTLGFVVANGSDKNGFSKENGRFTQMDNDLTHLSIFFGWNDSYYGPIMKREDWLFDTYGTKIYYPRTSDLIGTNAEDGTPYATQEQYNAVNAVTGEVGGIQYDSASQYFNALYIGTKDDTTNKTFWGAWNIILPYLIEKYPLAKILLIVPFGTTRLMRQCVRDAAQKYGLTYYDFSSINNDNKPNGMIAEKTISQFRIDNLTYDGLHPNENGYKYLYPSINAKLMSI